MILHLSNWENKRWLSYSIVPIYKDILHKMYFRSKRKCLMVLIINVTDITIFSLKTGLLKKKLDFSSSIYFKFLQFKLHAFFMIRAQPMTSCKLSQIQTSNTTCHSNKKTMTCIHQVPLSDHAAGTHRALLWIQTLLWQRASDTHNLKFPKHTGLPRKLRPQYFSNSSTYQPNEPISPKLSLQSTRQ